MARPADTQLRLALDREPDFRRDQFVISESNFRAVSMVDAWPAWPNGVIAVVGPEGSGKTHLARAWAARAGATIANPLKLVAGRLPNGPVLLDDWESDVADEGLFHLLNRTDPGASVLLTSRLAPRLWATALPDLRSRLNAIVTVELGVPDDLLLQGVLLKLFRDKNIRPDGDLLGYLLRRIERSVRAAETIVARLDEAAGAGGREVTRALAREVLEGDDSNGDLFA